MVAMDNKSGEKVPVSRRPTAPKKKRKHKPKDFPKRPLSAYNIFFKETREEMLEQKEREVGKDNVDFQSMVKEIAARWKSLPPGGRDRVEAMAKIDLQRYKDEVRAYEDQMVERSRREREGMAQKKKEEEDKAIAAARARKQHEDNKLANEHMAMSSHHPSAGGQFSVLAQPESAQTVAEHHMILAQELRNLDAERELKMRQLQLAQLQAGAGPGSNLISSFHPPGAGRLSGLSAVDRQELEMLRRQAAVPTGLGLGGAPLGDYGLPAGLMPRMSTYPPLQSAYPGQDALLRGYALQEQDLLTAQLAHPIAADSALAGYGVPGAALSNDYFGARLAGHPGLSHGFPPSAYQRPEGILGGMIDHSGGRFGIGDGPGRSK